MSRLGPIAMLAAAAALSACSTAQRIGDAVWPFGDNDAPSESAPQDGRISIMAFEQALTPDPALAARGIVVPPPSASTDWSQPGGSADNTPTSIAGAAQLEVAWRASLGEGSNDRVRLAAPPVIVNGTLYFLDADHRVHAINAANGDRIWSQRLRQEDGEDRRARGGGLAVADGRVFVSTGFGFAVALDTDTGDELWRATAGAPFHAAPTVAGGRVYAVTNDNELVVMDENDGSVEWTYQAIAESARILSASSPAVDGETVIAPFASGELIAFIAANGRRLWVVPLSRSGRLTSLSAINDIAGRPAVDAGAVYAASHSGLIAAIDVRSGTPIWERSFASTQTPWVAGDVVYAVSVDGELVAFDKATGNIFWMQQLRRFEDEEDREDRISWTGPILVGGKLILANSLGEVVSVAPQTGVVENTRDLRNPIFIPPVAAGGLIYIVTDDARLVALR